MDKEIIKKYDMFTNVNAVFTQNDKAIDAVPALRVQVVVFTAGYGTLAGMMQPLLLNSTGNAKAKKAAKARLSVIGGRVCGAMRLYANDKKDPALFAKVNYSPSALLELRDLELQETGQALYDIANGLAAPLLDYGIKAAELLEFKTAVDDYKLLNPLVREVKVGNKTLRQQLFDKVEEVNNLLRFKLDYGMMVMEFTDPDFYDLYRNARRNYSDGVRHRQPVEDAAQKLASPDALSAFSNSIKEVMAKVENGVGAEA